MSGMARLLGDLDTASEVPIAKAYLLSIWGKQMFLNLPAIAFFFFTSRKFASLLQNSLVLLTGKEKGKGKITVICKHPKDLENTSRFKILPLIVISTLTI